MALLIEDLLLHLPATLRDALLVVDKNAQGICLAVDADGALVGTVTDGDVRRRLLAGGDLDDAAETAVNRNPTVLPVGTSNEEVQRQLSNRVHLIPLVDERGVPVDFACTSRLRQIPVLEPSIGKRELEYVTECVETGWVSSQGRFVREFEERFAPLAGQPYALTTSNGTTALHLALVTLGVGPGDEVVVPSFTFAASANAVLHAGATPVFVDVDPATWTMTAEGLEAVVTPRTKAVMPVHIYGHPCDMGPIMEVARRHGLLVVEDCAESLGATYRGEPTGSFGDAATFSFFGNKTITTGEGGMVAFADEGAHARAKRLRDHGMNPERRYWHDEVGFNYRLTNLQAALGVAQLERFPDLLARRREIRQDYNAALADLPDVTPQEEAPWASTSNWLYTVLLDDAVDRDEVQAKLSLSGIDTRPAFYPMHQMPPFAPYAVGAAFPVSDGIARRGLSLPSSSTLGVEEMDRVCDRLRSVLYVRRSLDPAS